MDFCWVKLKITEKNISLTDIVWHGSRLERKANKASRECSHSPILHTQLTRRVGPESRSGVSLSFFSSPVQATWDLLPGRDQYPALLSVQLNMELHVFIKVCRCGLPSSWYSPNTPCNTVRAINISHISRLLPVLQSFRLQSLSENEDSWNAQPCWDVWPRGLLFWLYLLFGLTSTQGTVGWLVGPAGTG